VTKPGRSLELYFIDGRPDGMLTAEVFNWTGHVLMFPRASLALALARPEAQRAGVYLLLGEIDGEPVTYVGESEDIGARFKAHEANKDWWTRAVIVTTAGNALNKAHIKHLEARLVEEAKAAGAKLDNGASPTKSGLSEAGRANMEAFLDSLLMILPALRVDVFLTGTTPDAKAAASVAASFELRTPKHGVSAEAVLVDGAMVVRAGATARHWTGAGASYRPLHAKLVAAGVLSPEGTGLRLVRDQGFASPSAAAAVLNGRSANGQIEWKRKGTTQTYKDWEHASLAKEAAE